MILSDGEIRQALAEKKITIDPHPAEDQYTTSAVDLFLGNEILELKTSEELKEEEPTGVERLVIVDPISIVLKNVLQKYAKPVHLEQDGSFIFPPRKLVLGITREYIRLDRRAKIAARVEGRSTLARLGLVVHLTAPTIHADFSGKIVLEMYNFGNYALRLHPGKLRICQLIFERLGRIPKGPIKTPYLSKRVFADSTPILARVSFLIR